MQEDGFMLIELLAVILIIGILAALALPTFLGRLTGRTTRPRKPTCVTQFRGWTRLSQSQKLPLVPGPVSPFAEGVSLTVTPDGTGFSVSKVSETGLTFTIYRGSTGVVRTCT